MTSLIRRSALIICILAIGAQASAEVVLLSQSRSVSGDGTFGERSGAYGNAYTLIASDDISILAPDFGLFEEEISIDLTRNNLVSVTQDSEIQTGHFSIHGSAAVTASLRSAYLDWIYLQSDDVDTRANSHFEVLFEVSTPTSFSLVGSLASTYTGTEFGWWDIDDDLDFELVASLQLDRDGVPYRSFSASYIISEPGEEIAALSEFGILEPGTYTLTVYASSCFYLGRAGPATANMFSSFDIDFFLETPVATDEMAWGQVKALYR
jgi:hypothetical protein